MSDVQVVLAVLIFAVTYAVIAFAKIPRLHLDRPGAALCGAALMVACGVLSFDDAWSAIDARTIVLLLGMMILNVLLEESGFFELAARKVLGGGRSPQGLLSGLVALSAVLSALFLNDTVCLMLTLPVLSIVRKSNLPAAPYLIALAASANIGSVATLIGNPQNMLIGSYSGISYGEFLLWMTPVATLSVVVLIAALKWFYGDALRAAATNSPALIDLGEAPRVDRRLLVESLVVLAGVLVGFVVVDNLPLVAIAGAAVLLIVSRRPPAAVLARVDWVLLAFFAALFIVVRGLEATGLVADAAARVRPMYGTSLVTQIPVFAAVTVLASNLVSNVPFVVLARGVVPELIEPKLMWLVLSMASTLAGNLTIPGSVATLIVLETARRHQPGETHVGFLEFFRIGLPVTVITVTLGALVLAAEHWLVAALQ
jgi:Na+/H+ antiporter NhaD/arsenite permease-like protein